MSGLVDYITGNTRDQVALKYKKQLDEITERTRLGLDTSNEVQKNLTMPFVFSSPIFDFLHEKIMSSRFVDNDPSGQRIHAEYVLDRLMETPMEQRDNLIRQFSTSTNSVMETMPSIVQKLNEYFSLVPDLDMLYPSPGGKALGAYCPLNDSGLPLDVIAFLSGIKITKILPSNLRTSHHHVLAGAGHGKTQCLQSLIFDDMYGNIRQGDPSIIVIDSQNRMIETLLGVVPEDRLVLIEPNDDYILPALNLFSSRDLDASLYEYIFSAFDASMTSMQTTLFQYVSRLMTKVPNATFKTMSEVLQPDGEEKFEQYIKLLDEDDQQFFKRLYDRKTNQYKETIGQVQRRLDTLISNKVMSRIFSAPENKLNLAEAVDQGKYIFISTSEEKLGALGASIFGRFWIAAIDKMVNDRKSQKNPRRCYVYIDEAADYLGNDSDEKQISRLFRQSRKYEVGLIVAHQMLDDLPSGVQSSIHSNTAIKMAGGTSAKDTKAMSANMRVAEENIDYRQQLNFYLKMKDHNGMKWEVEPGRVENLCLRNTDELAALRYDQQNLYYHDHRTIPVRDIPEGEEHVVDPDEVEEASSWTPTEPSET